MAWYLWIALGLVIAALELAKPGIFLIFFGIAALIVGGLAAADLVLAGWVQWLLFSVIALASLRLFRQRLLGRLEARDGADRVDTLVGEVALPTADIPPHGHGRAELRGSTWNAHNVADVPLAAGQRCRVVQVTNLVLDIRPE